ncbi:MAG: hypothetical protein ACRDNX_12170 [Gaiellaceae bacterium]
MTGAAPTRSRRRRPPARRPALVRYAAPILVGLVVFALGVGLGQALRDNPRPGGERTQVRTLEPLTVAPARETVTVTVAPP